LERTRREASHLLKKTGTSSYKLPRVDIRVQKQKLGDHVRRHSPSKVDKVGRSRAAGGANGRAKKKRPPIAVARYELRPERRERVIASCNSREVT
jgi:hypothetical protein